MSDVLAVPQTRMLRDTSWTFDREQEAADDLAAAALDRRAALEKSVTFAELIEEVAEFNDARADEFMKAFRMYSRGMPKMHEMFDEAFERIVERKLKGN